MTLTLEETREWYRIRDHVRQVVEHLEVCWRCSRVRELSDLVLVKGMYCCRPGDKKGCLGR